MTPNTVSSLCCTVGVLGDYFKQGVIIKETSETYVQKKIAAASAGGDSACIRHVAVLAPPGSKVSVDPVRQMKSSIDNTIYIYPLVFEKFQHRNLCIKVQLVEFVGSVTGKLPDPTQPYHILRNIYSTMPGTAFCSSSFTTVSYHSKLPILNEEIKIRLPDVLTDRHWLIFTVHHVHVKQKTATNKSFLGMVSFAPGELLDTSATILGAGFLPIISDGRPEHLFLFLSTKSFIVFLIYLLFSFFLYSSFLLIYVILRHYLSSSSNLHYRTLFYSPFLCSCRFSPGREGCNLTEPRRGGTHSNRLDPCLTIIAPPIYNIRSLIDRRWCIS
jgi:C2 domain in Dock180 and Zizimin proteins